MDQALEDCIEEISTKIKLETTSTLKPWNKSVLTIVKEKIKKLKFQKRPKQMKSINNG